MPLTSRDPLLLTIRQGAEPGRILVVDPGAQLTLGRSDEADIRIEDRRLSRIHARLDYSGARCRVVDLRSKNGVYINRRRIVAEELADEDELLIGNQVMRARYRDAGEETDFQPSELSLTFCGHCDEVIPETAEGAELKHRNGVTLCPDCALILEPNETQFEGFEVQKKLGVGSVGLVYRARSKEGQIVALKVLRRRALKKRRRVLRFLREASTICHLNHPNIVRVYGAGEFHQGYYLVIEYFPGEDLFSYLRREGVLPVKLLVSVGIQVARALDHAASHGVVHRDVKPANILWDELSGLAKLSDFGLAKQLFAGDGRGLTEAGEGLGTPSYMPPEQVKNAKEADSRSDIYSLGATLYHLATNRIPAQGKTYKEFMTAILHQAPPPIRSLNEDCPRVLETIIARCMEKRPEDRYQEARELIADLETVHRGLLPPKKLV